MFPVLALNVQRLLKPREPTAGGEGVFTAFHEHSLSPPAVTSGAPAPRRSNRVLGAAAAATRRLPPPRTFAPSMMRWRWYSCPAAARGERAQRAPRTEDTAVATKQTACTAAQRPTPSGEANSNTGWGDVSVICSLRQSVSVGPAKWHLTFCAFRRPESRPSGRRRAVHRPSQRPISPPAVASGRRPRRGKSVLADVRCGCLHTPTAGPRPCP
jgi:hypothetical protein